MPELSGTQSDAWAGLVCLCLRVRARVRAR